MDIHTGRQRRFPAVAIVFVLIILCIVPGQLWIAKQFPAISGLAQIDPVLIFRNTPAHLPVPIDLVVAPGLFLLIYPLVILTYSLQQRIPAWQHITQRISAALAGLFIALCCILAGGWLYFMVQDHLPQPIRNTINSYGINADIHLSYSKHDIIYLRGSMVLLVCFFIGLLICIHKIRKAPRGQLTREQRMTPYQRMLQEKRMKLKQMPPTIMQTARSNAPSRFCHNQPVFTLKPEAVAYMPMD